MGARIRRREQFFRDHPNCCFCGGNSRATTEDHQPARTYFKGREWPEGSVFPACQACNEATRKSEKILSLVVDGYIESPDRSEYQRLVRSIQIEYPGLIDGMIPNHTNEVRRILRESGLRKPEGQTYRDFPIIKLDRDVWDEHINNVGRKILLALHYMCFRKPLSSDGGMWLWVHTNFDWATGRFPEEIIEMAQNVALPTRQQRFLGDQFAVRWNYVDEPRCGLFVAHLQGALTISGITSERPADFKQVEGEEALRPWSW